MEECRQVTLILSASSSRIKRALDGLRKHAISERGGPPEWLEKCLGSQEWKDGACWIEIDHPTALEVAEKMTYVAWRYGVDVKRLEPAGEEENATLDDELDIDVIASRLGVKVSQFPPRILRKAWDSYCDISEGKHLREINGKRLDKDPSIYKVNIDLRYRMIFRRQSDGSLKYQSLMTHETYTKAI